MPSTSAGDYDDAPAPAAGGEDSGSQQPSGQTAMLNKAVLGGGEPAPGDNVTLTVVAVHGDEVEVKCAGKEQETDSAPPEGGEDMYG